MLRNYNVATVLTVYGIETEGNSPSYNYIQLQQYLPFTVLKPGRTFFHGFYVQTVATVLTVYGIETLQYMQVKRKRAYLSCNSTYRLRY